VPVQQAAVHVIATSRLSSLVAVMTPPRPRHLSPTRSRNARAVGSLDDQVHYGDRSGCFWSLISFVVAVSVVSPDDRARPSTDSRRRRHWHWINAEGCSAGPSSRLRRLMCHTGGIRRYNTSRETVRDVALSEFHTMMRPISVLPLPSSACRCCLSL